MAEGRRGVAEAGVADVTRNKRQGNLADRGVQALPMQTVVPALGLVDDAVRG